MSIDSVLRAIGAFTCIYTIGLFVTVMSTVALDAAARDTATLCAGPACQPQLAYHHAGPQDPGFTNVVHTAALFLAGE